jgi:hypothetical protein
MPFLPSASCRNLDLPPVNLRFLQSHLTKNAFAIAPTHLCGIALKIRPLPEVETGREGTQTPKRDAGRRKRIPQRGQLTHNFMKHCRQERLQKY